MKVNNKLIKKFINNICIDINKMRKRKNGDIIKNINALLGKKCLQSPFILDSIKTDKNTNPNECFGVAIIPSYNNIKMISSKIRNQDDIDNITTALFKTSKIKFDLILDKRMFEVKAPFIFTDDEITIMIFHQILNLFDETFKNQIILNYENLLKYENGYGGLNSLVYSSFCQTHSKIYDKPVNGNISEIDKQIVILGFYKQLVGALTKIDAICSNNILDSSILSNFVNKVGVSFSNNTGRIELINKFNKNNKITSVDLSVVNYFNEEESNMNDNKYELTFLHEAYFGKSKNLLEVEKLLDECSEYCKKKSNTVVGTIIGLDIQQTTFVNKRLITIEKILKNEFGFKNVSISLSSQINGINAFTLNELPFNYFVKTQKVKNLGNGVKFIDGSLNLIVSIGDKSFLSATGGELTGILLHEIGHNFYNNNNAIAPLLKTIIFINKTILNKNKNIGVQDRILEFLKDMVLVESIRNSILYISDKPFAKQISSIIYNAWGKITRLQLNLGDIKYSILGITKGLIKPIMFPIGNMSPLNLLTYRTHVKSEKFADNFATSYGYGAELSSGLIKLNLDSSSLLCKIPVVRVYADYIMCVNNIMSMFLDCHPQTYTRVIEQKEYLEKEIKNADLASGEKEIINRQIEDINKMIKQYPKDVMKNSVKRGNYITSMFYALSAILSDKGVTPHAFIKTDNNWKQFQNTGEINESTEELFEEVNPMAQRRVDKIEEVVGNLKIAYLSGEKSEISKNEKLLTNAVNDICKYFNKKITVNDCSVCTDNGNNEDDMFGARAVFTSMENISKYLKYTITMENMDKVLSSSFEHADFNLEIDHNILENNQYNFSNKEIVSIILHELGHMLDINVYSRVAMAYQSAIINLANIKSLKNSSNTRALCALYLISNIESDRLFSRDRKSITVEEIRADSFVGNLGLSNDLNSAIDKFYKINKHNFFKSKNFKEMVSDAENFVQASMTYHNRKRKINRLILTEKIKQTSKSIKSLLSNISKDVLKNGDDKISDGNVYIKDDDIGGIVNESFDFIKKFKKSPNKISSYDIDTLRIQSDMIEDINDKQIMLYKIFKRKNQISELLSDEEFKKENKDYSILLQSYMNTLNDLYNKVMNVKITNQIQKYGVFIKYPKGYEG